MAEKNKRIVTDKGFPRGNVLRDNSWSHNNESDEELLDGGNTDMSQNEAASTNENPYTIYVEEQMRRKLRFFFMNPIEKWQARRQFPYKFCVQVVKIILVTIQLCLFAHNNYIHVSYSWDNKISFSHLFLKGWDTDYEVPGFPPPSGPLAVYRKDKFYESIDYALDGYYNLSNAIGSYSYIKEDNTPGPVILCMYNFKRGSIFGFNESYIFDNEVIESCSNIADDYYRGFSTKMWFEKQKLEINSSLVKAILKFAVKTVNLKTAGPITPPDCYQFDIKIIFDNSNLNGRMLLSLDAQPRRLVCEGDTKYITDDKIESALRTLLNSLVIVICSISLMLCSRSIYRAQLLKFETIRFFKTTYNKSLNFDERLEFLNFWYIMIIINDFCIIIGSGIKEQIESYHFGGDHWNICSIFLGTGNLLVWFGVLRYLGFFKTYNVVILTLKKSMPKVARFLLCAILIYAGFTFCGWLVLGPYHMKFRSLATTSECLFSLINGDDMFATFTITSFKSPMLWWYSRIYLYSFIALFTYVILSLFIAIITDAYETIKDYYQYGFPTNDLQKFIAVCKDEASSGVYRQESDDYDITNTFSRLCCCKGKPLSTYLEENVIGKIDSLCGGTSRV